MSIIKMKKRKPFKYFNILLFIIGLLFLLNFESLVLYLNSDYYITTRASVVEEGKDQILGVLPRYKLSYKFDGSDLEVNKILYAKVLFTDNIQGNVNIYVNRKSYEDVLLPLTFTNCWLNYVLIGLALFCVWQVFLGLWVNTKLFIKKRSEKRKAKILKKERKLANEK